MVESTLTNWSFLVCFFDVTCYQEKFYCQLTEIKQTKGWERYPKRFRRLCETLLPKQKLGKALSRMASRQNRVRDQENSKPQDLIVYTDGSVTKDQSGWGFTVKQGAATTIHEHSAPYTVSTSSLTMEVEAVTHALRWIATRGDSRTTHAILLRNSVSLLQKVKRVMGSPNWNVSMVDIHLRKLLWLYCPGHAGVKACISEDLKC